MHALQIVTLLMSAASSTSQRFDVNGRPKCCSDSLSPLLRQQSWLDILRQATYQSIIRHLDYTGTLDGRLDRDHALWKLLQQARYVDDTLPKGDAENDIRTGALIEIQETQDIDFEFQQKDKSIFDCPKNRCHFVNNSVMAVWRVRTIVDPYELWIMVKIPNVRDGLVEDVYKYNEKFGLQKLNPDPLQLKSKSENDHRFYIAAKTKSGRQLMSRMDFLFPGQSKSNSFGVGRAAPPPFGYNSPMLSGRSVDGWMFSARKPHPGVVVDAGPRNHHSAMAFNPLSGPFIALGPQGYRHIIYSLPSIAPTQQLDSQDFRGFLPSVGPINVSPPFKTELPIPPYTHYYNKPPARYITPPSKQFNPSTEFVRYSELDPLYHSEGESESLHTSEIPDHDSLRSTISFPSSINDVLPTHSPLVPTNAPMQIIVKDLDTTTKTPQSTNKASKIQIHKTRLSTKPTSKSNTTNTEKGLTKAFGEKIKPKNLTTTKPSLRTDGKLKYTTKSTMFTPQNRFNNNNITYYNKYNNMVTTLPTEIRNKPYTTIVSNTGKRLNKNITPITISKDINESTETSEPIDVFTEFTTEEVKKKQTTYLDVETTTENNDYEENTSIIETEAPTKEKKVVTTSRKTTNTMVVGIPMQNTESQTHPTETVNYPSNSSDLYDDYYTDETTDSPVDLTTVKTYDPEATTESTETDFFPTLTDALFAIETTTQATNQTTTITPMEKSIPQNEDAETQESQQQRIQYRLLTFPGDSVSIVANRISKSVSYRTADGKERKLQHKIPNRTVDRFRLRDYYKDYSTIL